VKSYAIIVKGIMIGIGSLLISKYDADKTEPKKTKISGGFDTEL